MGAPNKKSSVENQREVAGYDFEYHLYRPSVDARPLQSIWQLVAGNLAASGDVLPHDAMSAAKSSEFDFSSQTQVVVIRHASGRLAGTFSLTKDSDAGMPVSQHFNPEIEFLRRKHQLINGWRFSMSPLYQSAILRQRSFALFKQLVRLNDADGFVLYYNQRLEAYYHRLFKGRVLATKSISFDGYHQLPVNLMFCTTADNPPDPKYLTHGDRHEKDMVL